MLQAITATGATASGAPREATYLERGRPVVLLARWNGKGPRNVLVRREDGRLVSAVAFALAAYLLVS